MKKLEEISYVGRYVLLSLILVLTMVCAIWNELIVKRPWKYFQDRFHELELKKAKERMIGAVKELEEPEVKKKYAALSAKLEEAKENFERPIIQEEYQKALEKLQTLDKEELAPLKFEAIITRNKLQEEAYEYGKHKKEETLETINMLEERNKELAAEIKRVEGKRAIYKKRVDAFKSKIAQYEDELNAYTVKINEYKSVMDHLASKRPQLQHYQVHLEEINEADRCMSCHPGIDKSESVSEEQPYSSHPRRDVYLGNHPPDKFGCVLCHEGQAQATTSPEKAHGEVEFWLRPMIKGEMIQSSCISCHNNVIGLGRCREDF